MREAAGNALAGLVTTLRKSGGNNACPIANEAGAQAPESQAVFG
jgi:hypothetical protein